MCNAWFIMFVEFLTHLAFFLTVPPNHKKISSIYLSIYLAYHFLRHLLNPPSALLGFLQRKQYYDVNKNKNMTAFPTKGSWYGVIKTFLGQYHQVLNSRKAIKQGGGGGGGQHLKSKQQIGGS